MSRSMITSVLKVLLVLALLVTSNSLSFRNAQAQISPFLISPYYGNEGIYSFFDHEYPDYTNNGSIVIYTGERRSISGSCQGGYNCYSGHPGYDYRLNHYERVLASAAGTVDRARWNNLSYRSGPNAGLGLYVRIAHSNSYHTYYGHLSVAAVNESQIVYQGQMIGTSGNTGNSTGPHLHFEVRRNAIATDPYGWSGSYTDPWQTRSGETSYWLWMEGEPVNRPLIAPTNYGSETIIDDTPDNTGGFTKGKSGSLACPPESCLYWHRVTNLGYGSDMYWTYDNGTAVDYWAQWRPNFSQPGLMEVYAYIPSNYATTWLAPYTIYHANGSTAVRVDQLGLSNQWISLGIYRFASGTSGYVRITDATGENVYSRQVGVDAIKFQRVNIGPIEAESFYERTSTTHSWSLSTAISGYFGSGFMQATPNNGTTIDTGYTTSSPSLRYRLIFPASGTYYIWIRGYGGSAADDSLHAGLNNQGPASADRISGCGWNGAGWYWCSATIDGPRATLSISPLGFHTFYLWMREDGFRVDRALLTIDPSYTP